MEGTRHIIMFDGVCNMCDAFVNFVYQRDVDRIFYFVPLQSALGRELVYKYNYPPEISTVIYIDEPNGTTYSHSSAVLSICSYLSKPWPFLYGFMLVPPIIRDFCYSVVAKYRYAVFGKKDGESCGYNPGLRKRFLDYAHVTEAVKDV